MALLAKIAAVAGIMALGAGSAYAGDGVDWTGPYIGAQAALLAQKSLEHPEIGGDTLLGDMGGGAGAFAGFNYQIDDQFVVGIEAEGNYDSLTLLSDGNNLMSSNWDAAIKAKLGMPVAPNVLAYGTLGYDWANFSYGSYFVPDGHSFTVGGLQFGVGVQAMLTDNILGRIEATYTHFGSDTVTDGLSLESTPSLIAVKAGLGFKF